MPKKLNAKKAARRVDQDNPEWTKEDFARAVPFSALPERLQRALTERQSGEQKVKTFAPDRFDG